MGTPSASYGHFLRGHWQLLGFCLLVNFCSRISPTSCIALFNGHLQWEFSLSASQLGGLFAAATLLSGAALPWVGALLFATATAPLVFGPAVELGLGGDAAGAGLITSEGVLRGGRRTAA